MNEKCHILNIFICPPPSTLRRFHSYALFRAKRWGSGGGQEQGEVLGDAHRLGRGLRSEEARCGGRAGHTHCSGFDKPGGAISSHPAAGVGAGVEGNPKLRLNKTGCHFSEK